MEIWPPRLKRMSASCPEMRTLSGLLKYHQGKSNILVPGKYKDSCGGRVCEISVDQYEVYEVYGVYGVYEEGVKVGEMRSKEGNKVELEANWGANGSLRKWEGEILKGGLKIAWRGRRGVSWWERL